MAQLKQSGSEPIPGYRLIEFLGRGGFGEVWKCQVPGGLFKAIKFVRGDDGMLHHQAGAHQELQAFERVKVIRHPFLLSVERVEFVDGELVTVTELADKSLADRLREYQASGLAGIPREELLLLMMEAAEALDVLNLRHGLQHLDVKPNNLFLVDNHVKVADFGLVKRVADWASANRSESLGPVTPLYCSPEVFQGKISDRSDQYSLAVVYQELLTGQLPFDGANARQLMLKHVQEAPNLHSIPECEQPVLCRALAKDPAERFPSCLDFVQALVAAHGPNAGLSRRIVLSPQPAAPSPVVRSSRIDTPASVDLRTTPIDDRRTTLSDSWPADGTRFDRGANACRAGLSSSRTPLGDPPPGLRAEERSQFTIAGFQPVECISPHNPGEMWKVQGPNKQLHIARVLPAQAYGHPDRIAHYLELLGRAQHAALPQMELVPCSRGMALLARDCGGLTLSRCYQDSVSAGLPGIPREELLQVLARAAEALDMLRQEDHLCHLGLNPLSILVERGDISFTDFGLVSLLWLPSGLALARCHQRYAAPEVMRRAPGDRSDQYSLALLFAELATGFHPRPRSGSGPQRGPTRLEMTLLSTNDQHTLGKALSDQPEDRFESCMELIDALGRSGRTVQVRRDQGNQLVPVISVADLHNSSGSAQRPGPAVRHLLAKVFERNGYQSLDGYPEGTYWRNPECSLECTLPLRRFGKTLRLKLEAFCESLHAQIDRRDDNSFTIRLAGQLKGNSLWGRLMQRESGLAMHIEVQPPSGETSPLAQACIRITPIGATRSEPTDKVKAAAVELLDRLLPCLDVVPEERSHLRLSCNAAVNVYPVLAGGQIGECIVGIGKNISLSGVGLLLPRRPVAQIYLHFPDVPELRLYALLARVVHTAGRDDQTFDIGVTFATTAEAIG